MTFAKLAIACAVLALVAAQDPAPSPKPIEVVCEVGPSTTIVKLVPDGKVVARGDLLVELDPTPIQDRLQTLQASVEEAKAQLAEAEAADKAAREQLKIVTEQTIPARTKDLERAIEEADSRLQKAKARLEEAQKRFKPGSNPGPLNDARQAVVKEEQAAAEARTALKVYRDLTAPKDRLQAETEARAAGSARANLEAALQVQQSQEARARGMLDRCKITAPSPGKVVHSNPRRAATDKRPRLIREGATVREGQVILRIHPRG